MYKKIKQHTNSHELYVQKLLGEGSVSQVGGRCRGGIRGDAAAGAVGAEDHLLAMRGRGGGGRGCKGEGNAKSVRAWL